MKLDEQTILAYAAGSILLYIAAFFLMLEDIPSTKAIGKWKRVKVKKDTTVHIQEDDEEG